ncbi:protein of unknown function [Tenacibaculum sp. 190524A02b]|uniref:hypothetical protein n=1 Tax=Tenacibaculum vairaonense TaxID=3137860 RepID=UPI0032B138F8
MRYIYLVLLLLVIFSCGKVSNEWKDGKGIIYNAGKYRTYDNNELIIEAKKDGTLKYFLKDIGTNNIVAFSKYDFSKYHSWYLIYDENGLWFYSGDIGSVYWKKEKASFKEIVLVKEKFIEYSSIIPSKLKEELEYW